MFSGTHPESADDRLNAAQQQEHCTHWPWLGALKEGEEIMSLIDVTTVSVLKRDGRSVRFDPSKIYRAIETAMNDRGLEDHAFCSQAT